MTTPPEPLSPKPAKSWSIVPAIREDIPAMVELLTMLFTLESDFHPDPPSQEKGLALLLSSGDRSRVFVARTPSGQVSGMITVQLLVSTAKGGIVGQIEDVAVLPSIQGRGIGRALIETALDFCRQQGALRCQLQVDLSNVPAQRFYRRMGFQTTKLGVLHLFPS